MEEIIYSRNDISGHNHISIGSKTLPENRVSVDFSQKFVHTLSGCSVRDQKDDMRNRKSVHKEYQRTQNTACNVVQAHSRLQPKPILLTRTTFEQPYPIKTTDQNKRKNNTVNKQEREKKAIHIMLSSLILVVC